MQASGFHRAAFHAIIYGCLSLGQAARGLVAQSVEQRTENPCVGGSIPPQATNRQGQPFSVALSTSRFSPCHAWGIAILRVLISPRPATISPEIAAISILFRSLFLKSGVEPRRRWHTQNANLVNNLAFLP